MDEVTPDDAWWTRPAAAEGAAAPDPAAPWERPSSPQPRATIPPPPAMRVGAIPLRPLTVGDMFSAAGHVVRSNWKSALILGVPFIGLYVALMVPLSHQLSTLTAGLPTSGTMTTAQAQELVHRLVHVLLGVYLPFTLLLGVWQAFTTGVWSLLAADAVVGEPVPSLGDISGRVGRRLLALIGVTLVTTLMVAAGTLALIIPGIALWGLTALAAPALMIEQCGVRRSIGRAWRLTTPDFWRIWGIRVLTTLVVSAVTGVLGQLAGVGSFVVVGALVVGAVAGLGYAWSSAVLALQYVDARIRRENLAPQLAEALIANGARAPMT
jgi:hypothetical protein